MLSIQRQEENPCRPRHFKPPPCAPIVTDTAAHARIETCRNRLLVAAGLFVVLFLVIAARLVDVSLIPGAAAEPRIGHVARPMLPPPVRANIIDRNGRLLATTLDSPSLYADTRQVVDPAGATRQLLAVLPHLDPVKVYADLSSGKSFVWIKRHLTPRQQYDVNRLGIPGLQFEHEALRFYPFGNLTAHVVGYSKVYDNRGLGGVERSFDSVLKERHQPLQLSIDARVQFVLREELQKVVDDFTAKGATGIVMNVNTGEVVAMVSLPDFDPNHPMGRHDDDTPQQIKERLFNKATLGDYELGSVFKIFDLAMALDDGVSTMTSRYDASHPIHVGRFTISDYHGKDRWLSLPEVFAYSSNIGAARIALAAGEQRQKAFLRKIGLLNQPKIHLDEISTPHYPKDWRDVNVMTISYGHGISVSPIGCLIAFSAMVNGGILRPATLLKVPPGTSPPGVRVISKQTSDEMRKLLRLVVERGTARQAEAPGYVVGGKTGTAEKNKNGHYEATTLVSTFVSAFPMNDPQYAVLALVDEPHGTKKSHGYATAGWTAVPATQRIIERIAPLLGVAPVDENSPEIENALQIRSLIGHPIAIY